jgi:hypothetical protein
VAVSAIAAAFAAALSLWAVVEARRNVQAAERPWVLVDGILTEFSHGEMSRDQRDWIRIKILCSNHGKGPALNVVAAATTAGVDDTGEGEGRYRPYPGTRKEGPEWFGTHPRRMLAAGQSVTAFENVPWPRIDVDLENPSHRTRLIARVSYDDQYGQTHTTQFCREATIGVTFTADTDMHPCPVAELEFAR